MDNGFDFKGFPFLTRQMLDFQHGAAFSLILQLCSVNNITVEIRGYTKAGPFTYSINHTGSNTPAEYSERIPDVPIAVSVQIISGGGFVSTMFAALHLGISENRIVMLTSGNITDLYGIAWPQQINQTKPQTESIPEIITVGIDGPGIFNGISVPNNQIWEILSIGFRYVSTSTAGNRTVAIVIDNGSLNSYDFLVASGTQQTASQTRSYNFQADGVTAVTSEENLICHEVRLPKELYARQGRDIFITSLSAVDDDDVISLGRMLIKRNWILNT